MKLAWKATNAVGYMAVHQHDKNAIPLWTYFQNVLNWAISTFNIKKFKIIMKGVDWALFYDKYHEQPLDIKAMEARITDLIGDDEIQKPNGIIPYVLTGDERYLDLRTFKDKVKKAIWEKQNHKCAICGKEFDFELMEGDHIKPWREGGRTDIKNCQMLCRQCNRNGDANKNKRNHSVIFLSDDLSI